MEEFELILGLLVGVVEIAFEVFDDLVFFLVGENKTVNNRLLVSGELGKLRYSSWTLSWLEAFA